MYFQKLNRLAPLVAGVLIAATSFAAAQDKPVTPPDSYRVVMENERVRMIEIHVKPHSKVNVDSPLNRERFLYMLSDGALILAPPGKTPYEFALHAGETAVFPALSPTVENDTDSAVRALMVEMKDTVRAVAVAGRGKGRHFVKGKARSKSVAKASPKVKSRQAAKVTVKSVAKSRNPKAVVVAKKNAALAPLNLHKAASKPGRKVSSKSRGNNS